MTLDYKKLGFKCGIEIHQELSTNKLFCSCSTNLNEEEEVFTITRKLRAVAGESNKTDQAVLYESLRDRSFIYHGFKNEACLVESDSEPPHPVNKDAMNTALSVAKIFKLKIPNTICVMRKTVTDGSATGGFQRTMLIGIESHDSILSTSFGDVKVNQLNLEEDSCKIIEKKENSVHYSLSRLGIPLLEIGTDATIKNPQQAKEVAFKIGSILRSYDTVKRGLGTIRQDVNVSIKKGARIEIKGWQDLKSIPILVENEVKRQKKLVEIKERLIKKGLKKFEKNSKDVTDIFKKSNSKIIKNIIKNDGKVYALKLPKFSGLLKEEICPEKTFGKELSEYAKAYGTKGMIHTDEDINKYNLISEFDKLSKIMDKKKDDLIIVIAEKEKIALKAINSVYERALYCLKGIPEETRIPNHKNATSMYARPLPGANRMYPETDIPNVKITKEIIKNIIIPELIEDKIKRYAKKFNIQEDMAKELINKKIKFSDYTKKYSNLKPSFLVECLINYEKEIYRRYNKKIDAQNKLIPLFEKANKNEINKDAIFEILVDMANDKKIDYAKYKPLSDKEIETTIQNIISKNKDAPMNAIIGKVMGLLRGKASGKKIVDLIKKNY
ncbi:Glu-tRNA(Gln) amidotransferase subunit GatE [archaeon]|nr:Glu-tRNA(Gln) amidotransferase subunit GatE [archaeon]MBT7391210.1 Glu-tRNA(Gln) amidotransferase subunit GatE [archaeon]